MKKSFHSHRQQYAKGVLHESHLDSDPAVQLDRWLSDALDSDCPEPLAMILSTADTHSRPSSRVVLMKTLDERGIGFFSNYESRKGRQLLDNPQASLLFFWPELERQVRVEGSVMRVSENESDAYFDSRPEASRISAVLSPQSREIPDRKWLEDQRDLIVQSARITRPPNWGGYRLIPDYFEFWQGREDRLHDRIAFRLTESGWEISRLAP